MRQLFSLAVIALCLGTTPAWAHKVIGSGYAAGDQIEGEVGFSNGDPGANVRVEITAPDGRALGEATTDADGLFRFTPRESVPHLFRADLGAGHVAEFRMEVSDLPRTLQGGSPEQAPPSAGARQALPSADPASTAALRDLIAEAVRDEIRPLRRELTSYKEQTNIQTVLGGIGYILGLVGISFYWLARQRLKAQQ